MDNQNVFKGHVGLKLVSIIALVALMLYLAGCCLVPIFNIDEKKVKEAQERFKEEDAQKGRIGEPDDLVLGEGEVLKIRLSYGTDTKNTHSWYKVRLDNPQNGWYDYVEYISPCGFGGKLDNNYNDYTFYYENFKKQLKEDHYNPPFPAGEYTLTITGSNGHFVQKKMEWKGSISDGEWVLGHKVMAFSVP